MFGSGTYKAAFDKLSGIANWRIHDLRRTARSLMSRAGVQTEIAERVLGHAQGELIQIYDRHHYQDEMASALEKLAALIQQIVEPS
jgi:integrase